MITIRHRAPKARWSSQELRTDAEATTFVRGLPKTHEVILSGQAEPDDNETTPRAMWTGAISFGMVTAPVKLYAATEDGRPSLRQLCREHSAPISFQRWCEHGHKVEAGESCKGVKIADAYVPLTDSELDELPSPTAKVVQVQEFIPWDAVPLKYLDSVYFIGPDSLGRKAYDLLETAMVQTGTVAIAKVTMRDRERLAMIRPEGGRLVLYTLHWMAEVRSNSRLPNLAGDPEVNVHELKLAVGLIEGMRIGMFDPSKYSDTYAAALLAKVETKAETVSPVQPPAANVIDLMGALTASVKAAKATRGRKAKAS